MRNQGADNAITGFGVQRVAFKPFEIVIVCRRQRCDHAFARRCGRISDGDDCAARLRRVDRDYCRRDDGHAWCTCGASRALSANRAGRALLALRSLWTRGASRTSRTSCTSCTSCTSRASCTGWALRTFGAGGAGQANRALRASRTSCTSRARCTGRSFRTSRAGRPLWPGRAAAVFERDEPVDKRHQRRLGRVGRFDQRGQVNRCSAGHHHVANEDGALCGGDADCVSPRDDRDAVRAVACSPHARRHAGGHAGDAGDACGKRDQRAGQRGAVRPTQHTGDRATHPSTVQVRVPAHPARRYAGSSVSRMRRG